MGVAPGFIGIYLLDSITITWKTTMYIIIIIAFILATVALIFTNNYAEELSKACLWFI